MRLLIYILLAYLVYRFVRAKMAPQINKQEAKRTATEILQDPVCGVYLSESDAVVGRLDGKRYHFCSHECLHQFEKNLQQR